MSEGNTMRKATTATATTTAPLPARGCRPRPLGTTRRPLRRRGSPLPTRPPRRPPLHHRAHRTTPAQRRPRTGQLVLPHRARRPLGAVLAHDHLARREGRHAGSRRRLPRHAGGGGPRQGRRLRCLQAGLRAVRHRGISLRRRARRAGEPRPTSNGNGRGEPRNVPRDRISFPDARAFYGWLKDNGQLGLAEEIGNREDLPVRIIHWTPAQIDAATLEILERMRTAR